MSLLKSELLKELQAIGRSCVTCQKALKDKEIRKKLFRCKKCIREYKKICPTDAQEFLKIFEGNL